MAKAIQRQAYTMIELMLVIALIVAATALAIPAIQSMLLDGRITASGDAIRGSMAEVRSKALDEGRPWKLGFTANTGVFQYAPEDSSAWDGAEQDPVYLADLVRDELPKDVIFALNASDIAGSIPTSSGSGGWITIGIYLPDGSARDDRTIYFGSQGISPMRMVLRGLTGAVAIEVPDTTGSGQP